MSLGYSIHRDLYGCKNFDLLNAASLREIVRCAVAAAGLHIAEIVAGDFSSEEHGDNSGSSVVTLVYKLRESHLALHTWPQYKFVSIDFYTCGDPQQAANAVGMLTTLFAPKDVREWTHTRGKEAHIGGTGIV